MEEIFARRKARLMELRARRKGEDGEPKRLAARPVFDKCPSCGAVVPKTELSHSLYVCTKCGYHHTIGAYLRLAMLLDSKSFRELDQDLVAPNVLGFPGYEEKLERQRDKTGLMEAVVTARGRVEGRSVAAAALDSRFFMGSMGAAVGEKVTRCVEYAQRNRLPLIIFSASGGARMQEGILSLPYDRVEREDYEIFTLEDTALCDATSMEVFLEDWDSFSGQLRQAMENMAWALRHLEQKNEEES